MIRYVPDFVCNRRVTISDLVERSVKKGKGGEVESASRLAVLMCLKLDDAEGVYKSLKTVLVPVAQDKTVSAGSRAAVVRALAGMCFLGGGEMAEVVNIMTIMEGIFSGSYLRGDGSSPTVGPDMTGLHTAALASWALLVTLLSYGDTYRLAIRWGVTEAAYSVK